MNSNRQVVIVFKTRYCLSDPGHRLGIVGSIEPLGNWDASQCLLADESPNFKGNWSTKLSLPVATIFDWKWVVITEDRSVVIRWEERSNRTSAVAVKSGEIMALWNGETVFTPVTTHREPTQLKDTTVIKEVPVVTNRQVPESKAEIKPILKKSVSRESSPETRRVPMSSSPDKRIMKESSPELGRRSNEPSPVFRRRSTEERVRFRTDSLDPYVVKVQDDSITVVRTDIQSRKFTIEAEQNGQQNEIQPLKSNISENSVENIDISQASASFNEVEHTRQRATSGKNGTPYGVSNWTTDETEKLLNNKEVNEDVITAVQQKDAFASLPNTNHVVRCTPPVQEKEPERNGLTQTMNNRDVENRANTFYSRVKVKCSSVDRFESASEDGSSTDLRSLGSEESLRPNLKRSPSAIEKFFTSMCVIL